MNIKGFKGAICAFASMLVLLLITDIFLPPMKLEKVGGDHQIYINMAEYGWLASPRISPFLFRPIGPEMASLWADLLGLPLRAGFMLNVYLGLSGLGAAIYYLASMFTERLSVKIAVIAIYMFATKYIFWQLSYSYSPDSLAHLSVAICSIFALKQKVLPLMLVTLFGVFVKEQAIIPLLAFCLTALLVGRGERKLFLLAGTVAILVVGIILPRLLIDVDIHREYLDLTGHNLKSSLQQVVTDWPRNFNILFAIMVITMPVVVVTDYHWLERLLVSTSIVQQIYLLIYAGGVLLTILIGGTDLLRFAYYLFVPLVVVIATSATAAWRLALGLLFMALWCRVWQPIPEIGNTGVYLEAFLPYGDRIEKATLPRFFEILAYISVGLSLRWGASIINARSALTEKSQ